VAAACCLRGGWQHDTQQNGFSVSVHLELYSPSHDTPFA
jgi:hypothetical protein